MDEYNEQKNLTVTSSDSNEIIDVDTVAITVLAVDDSFVKTEEGIQVAYVTGVQTCALPIFSDVDGNLSTVQLAVANGTVTVTLSGTATITAGASGTATLTLSGSRSEERRVGKERSYQGTLNYNGPDTLIVTRCEHNVVIDVDTVAITVIAVDDAPVNTVLVAQRGRHNTYLGDWSTGVWASDGNLSTVQLAVANGTVTVTLSGTATITAGASGTATLTLSGS